MVKTTNVCTRGECGGECYKCRLAAVIRERDQMGRLVVRLYDAGIVSGCFGPWADHWTNEDKAILESWEEFEARFA